MEKYEVEKYDVEKYDVGCSGSAQFKAKSMNQEWPAAPLHRKMSRMTVILNF